MRLHENIAENKLKEIINSFIGKITQLPPVRSRVKREPREREIKNFEILEIDGKDVLFHTQVQAGTYIRKLCDDIGKKIGGAHMLELRRTKASIFPEENSINLYEFDKALAEYKNGNEENLKKILIPAEEAIKQVLPAIQVKENSIKQLLTGKPLMKSDILKTPQEEKFAVFYKEKFIAIMKKSEEEDIIARPEFVFN